MKKKRNKKTPQKKKKALISMIGSLALIIGCFVFVADQLSKFAVHESLPQIKHMFQWYPYNGIGVFENVLGIDFSIVHSINRGAAWGIFSEFQHWLFAFRVLFITALIIYLACYNKVQELTIPISLIIAGALGNVADYIVYGHVVDMFKFVLWGYEFPVFNIADTAIFLGVCGVFFLTLRNQNPLTSTQS